MSVLNRSGGDTLICSTAYVCVINEINGQKVFGESLLASSWQQNVRLQPISATKTSHCIHFIMHNSKRLNVQLNHHDMNGKYTFYINHLTFEIFYGTFAYLKSSAVTTQILKN